MNKKTLLIILFLIIGIIYRIVITWSGNFYFNMDNARDMVDVREMVVLPKARLIGPNSSIDGFFHGPDWYYLLAVPFILTGGDPYGSIIMEILFWAIGGFFLFKIVSKWGTMPLILAACFWVASNYIVLGTQYAFNPNPILFVTPIFIFLLNKYLQKNDLWISLLVWLSASFILHLEIVTGIFMPVIIILTILFAGQKKYFLTKNFMIGIGIFLLATAPQIIFDLRHNFIMSNSLIKHFSEGGQGQFDLSNKIIDVSNAFYSTLLPTFMNIKWFTTFAVLFFLGILILLIKKREFRKDNIFLITSTIILVTFIGFIFLPLPVNRWHLNVVMTAAIIALGFIVKKIMNVGELGKFLSLTILIIVFSLTLMNMKTYLKAAEIPFANLSLERTEIAAIDYVYQHANGKNFKVYTYLPSVIDYPYQYLFWWQGLKKYGYLPEDYAYAPSKPKYISQKERLDIGSHPKSSGLVFLIKEPDSSGIRHLWENSFKGMSLIATGSAGPLIIETRQDIKQ